MTKQTTPRISSLAAKIMGGYQPTTSEVKALAASALSQDETKGSEPRPFDATLPDERVRPEHTPRIAAPAPSAMPEDVRGFLYALVGSDNWREAASVWQNNPEQRKAAHAFLGKQKP